MIATLALGVWGCPSDEDAETCQGAACDTGTQDTQDAPGRDIPRQDGPRVDSTDDAMTDRLDGESDIISCQPNETIGCASGTELLLCNETGDGYVTEPCDENEICYGSECVEETCVPGETRCIDNETYHECAEDGSGWNDPVPCPPGTACEEDQCMDLCEISRKVATYIGCEYWAVDLDNDSRPSLDDPGSSPASQQYAVVISNPFEDIPAHITIHNGAGTEISLAEPEIPSLGLHVYELPRLDVDGTGVTTHVYHIESSIPVTAHQFNPANNVNVFSNDALLLLPTNALGMDYIILGWPGRYLTYNPLDPTALRGYATIVAVEQGTTRVTVTTPVSINAGGEVTAMNPGESRDFYLEQFEVLNLEMGNVDRLDITGMEISSAQQVAVFFGHECSNVPLETNYCDHLEQQMFPVDAWGMTYVAAKSYPRGSEPDVWRILASQDDTFIRTNPAQPGGHEVTLDRGEWVEFESTYSFDIVATAPILVGQYIVGSNYGNRAIPFTCNGGLTGIGDPAFMLNVPTAQYRTDYIVMTPLDYQKDYLSIIAPPGATVYLGDEPLDAGCFEAVGWGAYELCRILVLDGAHVLTSDQPFGLMAYGYDCDVSYGYPGGLNLESLIEQE